MWIDGPYNAPLGSFRTSVLAPDVDPDASPTCTVSINTAWIPFIIGCLKQLLLPGTWNEATDISLTQDRVANLIDLFACDGVIIPIACDYSYAEGDEHGWQPIVTPSHTYASFSGGGWHAGYQGTDSGQPYFQLQIYKDLPVEVYKYSVVVTYTSLSAVTIWEEAASPLQNGPYPSGVDQVAVIACNGDLDSRLRLIITTSPQNIAGTDIVVTRVVYNLGSPNGDCYE